MNFLQERNLWMKMDWNRICRGRLKELNTRELPGLFWRIRKAMITRSLMNDQGQWRRKYEQKI